MVEIKTSLTDRSVVVRLPGYVVIAVGNEPFPELYVYEGDKSTKLDLIASVDENGAVLPE